MIGLSMRLALALGLHLRNEDPSLNEVKREPLIRTWWCLHSIECLVSSITGRPPVIAIEDCTVSRPTAASQTKSKDYGSSHKKSRLRATHSSPDFSESSESGSSKNVETCYFLTNIDMTLIKQKVLLSLYSPRTAAKSWMVRNIRGPCSPRTDVIYRPALRALLTSVSCRKSSQESRSYLASLKNGQRLHCPRRTVR